MKKLLGLLFAAPLALTACSEEVSVPVFEIGESYPVNVIPEAPEFDFTAIGFNLINHGGQYTNVVAYFEIDAYFNLLTAFDHNGYNIRDNIRIDVTDRLIDPDSPGDYETGKWYHLTDMYFWSTGEIEWTTITAL